MFLHRIAKALWRDTLRPAIETIFPRVCIVCKSRLKPSERCICLTCQLDSAEILVSEDKESPMEEFIKGISPYIKSARAILLYQKNSTWVDAIYDMKYRGHTHNAEIFGEWMGEVLSRDGRYRTVDAVVAVPLHPLREIWRGYNQSDLIAHSCAKQMKVEFIRGALRRRRMNKAQAKRSRDSRWSNIDNLFAVSDIERLRDRNILLVDDVLTTGATILTCADEIHNSVPNCRIWIATIAFAERSSALGR